ncbi:hypothetical protein AB836_01670 [Rickettsiales bacterium (ex Bugula neritina AB1)]|nr:hypothetical protein AB836_01670 [Rickettsiales bacterium (ex Bugula neritina AB1)]
MKCKKYKYVIEIDESRDKLLSDLSKFMLNASYKKKKYNNFQELFANVASSYGDDEKHAQRLYDYISNLHFMPATPILANGCFANDDNNSVNLPISCFCNSSENNKEDIQRIMKETMTVSSADGGLGTLWSKFTPIGDNLEGGLSYGIFPYIKTQGLLTRYFGGSAREFGSVCNYLDIDHPQVEHFINMRKPNATIDEESKIPRHIHHGLIITNDFIDAVKKNDKWELKFNGKIHKTVDARSIWRQIINTRIETGEPFLIFIDNVNKKLPSYMKKLDLKVEMSNLCTEIVLPTGIDHLGNQRTSVCCLSSVNLEYYHIWKDNPLFIEDICRFLDNVLEDFQKRAPTSLKSAVYASKSDRAIGIGAFGLSLLFQKNDISFESDEAKKLNIEIFQHIKEKALEASKKLGIERGPCEDAKEMGEIYRNSHLLAIKPDACTALICNSSPNVEPIMAGCVSKNKDGSFEILNPVLENLLKNKGVYNESIKQQIISTGSVQNLSILNQKEKEIFKNAFEVSQKKIIEYAIDRSDFICQAQSINLFFNLPINAQEINEIHLMAAQNLKSLYYLRTHSQNIKIEDTYTSKENKMSNYILDKNQKINSSVSFKSSREKNNYNCINCD